MGWPARNCGSCGHDLRPDARFCTACGAAVPDGPPPGPAYEQPYPGPQRTAVFPPGGPGQGSYPVEEFRGYGGDQPGRTLPADEDAFYRPWPRPGDQVGGEPYGDRGGYPPGPGEPPFEDPGPPPPGGGPDRTRQLLIAGLVALVLIGVILIGLLVIRPFSSGGTGSPSAATTPSSGGSASPSASASTSSTAEQHAATALSGLLAKSVTDRAAVNHAYETVLGCGPGVAGAAQTFSRSATGRQQLLGQLGSLPNRSALPAQMLATLTTAWQASIQADQDYAQWAADEASHCHKNSTSNHYFKAAQKPDVTATGDKDTFITQWNPVAGQYHLKTYQQGDL